MIAVPVLFVEASRSAARSLRRTPWITAVVVFTLSLGIGATTAVFGVVDSLLIRPLPYANATLLLAVLVLTACYLPARRASRIDPASVLRTE